VTSWAQLLDEYEATIAALEVSTAAGEEPEAPRWTPPAAPTVGATAAELARFSQLQTRAAACGDELRAAMAAAGADLQTVRRTGVAARAYGEWIS
jgi:Lhr-like helicase